MPANWKTDPTLKIVKANLGKKEHEDHNLALTDLAILIYRGGNHKINFDHVQISLPRSEIELKVKKRIFDIGFIDRRGNTVLLEIKVIPSGKNKQPLK